MKILKDPMFIKGMVVGMILSQILKMITLLIGKVI